MRTVRRLLYADVLGAVAFVATSFLALFFFIDFVEELADVGQGAYRARHAAVFCLLELPGHFYELFPIAVLIGTIYAMARLAQSSEFTILRTGGRGPVRALRSLAVLGLAFGALTFLVGDYAGPYFDAKAQAFRSALRDAGVEGGGNSAWLKDHRIAGPQEQPPGERTDSINIGHVGRDGRLERVRIYEFAADGHLLSTIAARSAQVEEGAWRLEDVLVTHWRAGPDMALPPAERLAVLRWPTQLSPAVVDASVSPLRSMSTLDLYRYQSHLAQNDQAVQRQQIQFWKKALYPLACLVMVGLALPFAYMHARAGGVSMKVFGGILLGISFVLLNNVSTHLGLLRNWTPWLAAAAPSALYLLLSLAAFSWLVRFR